PTEASSWWAWGHAEQNRRQSACRRATAGSSTQPPRYESCRTVPESDAPSSARRNSWHRAEASKHPTRGGKAGSWRTDQSERWGYLGSSPPRNIHLSVRVCRQESKVQM